MKVIIDRFEGDYAVVELEIGKCINVPKILFPEAKEGDIIEILIDKKETLKRKKYMSELMNDMFED